MQGAKVVKINWFKYLGSTIHNNRQCTRGEEESAARVEWVEPTVRHDEKQKESSKSVREGLQDSYLWSGDGGTDKQTGSELNMFRSYNIENTLTFRILVILKIHPFAASISDSWFSKRNIPVVPN